jgi:hypothetical protein
MESIFLDDGELARVRVGQPFSGKADGPPSLDLSFRTTPGHQSGAGVSLETALELSARILLKLGELGAPTEKPCEGWGDNCGRSGTEPFIRPETGRLVWLCTYLCHPDYN